MLSCSGWHLYMTLDPVLCAVLCALQEFRTNMQTAYERCGFMGERVIGFAYKKVC